MKRIRGILAVCIGAGLLGSLAPAATAVAHTVYAVSQSGTITPIVDGVAQSPIPSGSSARAMAVTPDGKTAYVATYSGVIPLDLETKTPGVKIIVGGDGLYGIAITPDGRTAYVTNEETDTVVPLDLATHTVGAAIPVDDRPQGIAITPDGKSAYVANYNSGTVTPIDIETNTAGAAISMGSGVEGLAASPDGETVYVGASGKVVPIDTETQTAGSAMSLSGAVHALAIAPDGKTAYAATWSPRTVVPIDLETQTVKPAIPVTWSPHGIALTPDGKTAYVVDFDQGYVAPIDTETDQRGADLSLGGGSLISASTAPSQGPTADLSAPASGYAGVPVTLVTEVADDGELEVATLDFGDGTQRNVPSGGTFRHSYTDPGTYEVTLTVDDGEGCEPLSQFLDLGLASPFTGQTAYCNGPSRVTVTRAIEVRALSPLGLAASLKRRQSSLKSIRATVTCRNIECRARAFGRIEVRRPGSKPQRFDLTAGRGQLEADSPTALTAGIPAKAQRATRRALKAGGKVRARVRVAAEAPGGQRRVAMKRVRIVG